MDFRGFDSSRILISRVGIPKPMGNFSESLGQAILVGIILVGKLGVLQSPPEECTTTLLTLSSTVALDLLKPFSDQCLKVYARGWHSTAQTQTYFNINNNIAQR